MPISSTETSLHLPFTLQEKSLFFFFTIFQNIYKSIKGEWKLAGFNFSSFTNYKPGIGKTMTIKEFNAKKETFQTQPDFDYLGSFF